LTSRFPGPRARRVDRRKTDAKYHFTTREEFLRMIDAGMFLEHAEVFGHLYGTSRQSLDEALSAGHDLMLDIDVQGAAQCARECLRRWAFLFAAQSKVLRTRLRNRSRAEALWSRRIVSPSRPGPQGD